MNIILQNYNELLNKMILDVFSNNLKEQLNNFDRNTNVMNYVNLLAGLDETLCTLAIKSLVTIFEAIDKSFINTSERKRKYDIKSYHTRTIMTIFGEVTYKRTFYQNKLSGKSYCHVDRLLGLKKHDYFDPYLKALIIEYAANNSYPKVAKYINDLIGKRISIKEKSKYLSRQTVRNIIINSTISNPKLQQLETPDTLYIIADEKFIHTQNNNKKDIMMKSIVIFDGIKKSHNRKSLSNKMIFASKDNSFIKQSLDYIYGCYDVNKFKNIFIMGDGAKWIKSLCNHYQFNTNVKVIYSLDKFHFKQALRHIFPGDDVVQALEECILDNNKKDFNRLIGEIIDNYPHREKTVIKKQEYILNHWRYILNLYKYKLSCPMEAQISHNIADLFTSRPKAYSVHTIKKLTKLRLLYKNGFNLKELYLNNIHSDKPLTINDDEINYSHFDMFDKPSQYKITSTKGHMILNNN